MLSLFMFGLLMGMRHALEADHLAAVATLVSRSRSSSDSIRIGVAWGIGHTVTLLLFCSVVMATEVMIPEHLALWLEGAVGVLLMGLGADLIRRLLESRAHFHVHRHANGTSHVHAHVHRGTKAHEEDTHEHAHGLPPRSLVTGLMHGMAGSAALIMMTVSQVDSFWLGVGCVAFFGAGSIIGMGCLSLAIAWPLRHWSALGLTRVTVFFQGTIGVATLILGGVVVYQVQDMATGVFG